MAVLAAPAPAPDPAPAPAPAAMAEAKASVQLQELAALRGMRTSEVIRRVYGMEQDTLSTGLSPVERVLLQERLEEARRILPLRAAGVVLHPADVADLRVRHEWALEALRQGRVTTLVPPPLEAGEDLHTVAKRATMGDRVNPRFYRVIADALRAAGVDLATPTRKGSGWLGTDVGGEPLY